MKLTRKKFFLSVILIFSNSIFAQFGGDIDEDPDEIPIDGGIGLLIASGIAYGAYRFKTLKNK